MIDATEPPKAAGLPTLDRRSLLRGGALGAGLLASPLAAQFDPHTTGFTHGVASGEPGPDSVLLWTRYRAAQDTQIEWQVADSAEFTRTLAGGTVTASADHDWCCKATAGGLEPGRWYYYRFIDSAGRTSCIGRTRTLPEGPTQRWRMAVFSCSNIAFGYFNAYRHAAEDNSFDCALHLGDYFYEYGPGTYPNDPLSGRAPSPEREILSLADYRMRYAQYRSDPDLRRLHQVYPMISGWDDHEGTNDSWKDGAQNHQSDTEGPWSLRKQIAMRAYREWMPVSDEPWAAYQVGDLATLFRLETRFEARSEQFSLSGIMREGGRDPQAIMAALTRFREESYRDPSRELLGMKQQAWLGEGMKASRASGTAWQVLVQQVLMGHLKAAPQLAEGLPDSVPDFIRSRVIASSMAARAELPLNMDAWDGYPAARDRLLESALAADANLVSLAGDTHNAWAFELDHEGTHAGIEFGGHSVTSPGLGDSLTHVSAQAIEQSSVATNHQLKWMDAAGRGYMAVELTPTHASSEYRFLSGVRQRGAGVTRTHTVRSAVGSHRLEAG